MIYIYMHIFDMVFDISFWETNLVSNLIYIPYSENASKLQIQFKA